MASRRTHARAGALAGASFTLFRSAENQLPEILGGAFGGIVGAQVPDRIEPPTSSWHRGPAHSVLCGTVVTTVTASKLSAFEDDCRRRARRYAQLQRDLLLDPLTRFFYWLAEMFWRLATGFVAGFPVGYLSHLALDAFTPRGLPLLA